MKSTCTREDLQQLIEQLRAVYGVDHVVYHAVNLAGSPYAALTYRHEWVDHYHENNLARIDPVVQTAWRRFHPIDWKRLDWSAPAARALFRDAVDHGVGNQGYSLPIRGPDGQFALFTVNQNAKDAAWEKFTAEASRDLLLISHYFHQKVLEVEKVAEKAPGRDLSPRERDALHLLAIGLGRGQIADRLKISEHTLRVYVDSARFKLGALNTTHAVARALAAGIIFP
ncbi:MAG TPA: LuxR family transcriptional regulator [Paracoccaceae bacterium]|nr:LuxR family transcriptional regulator [Paracoccaceae bacterium]